MNIFRVRLIAAVVTFIVGVTITGIWITVRKPSSRVEKPRTEISEKKPPIDDSIAGTVSRLRENRVDSFDPGVPPAAQALIVKLKHQLRDFIQETLNSRAYEDDGPHRLDTMLNDELEKAGVQLTRDTEEIYDGKIPEYYSYGDIYEFKVSRPAGHRDLVAVTTTLGVCCGVDTSLYLFQYEGQKWNLVLAYESSEYDEIDGAHAILQYAVSPPEKNGDFFVAVANVNPWCTSNWQTLRYVVLKPVIGSNEPKVILSKTNTIYLGVADPVYELNLEPQGFRLSLFDEKMMEMANEGIDAGPDGIRARRLISYRVRGNSAVLRFGR